MAWKSSRLRPVLFTYASAGMQKCHLGFQILYIAKGLRWTFSIIVAVVSLSTKSVKTFATNHKVGGWHGIQKSDQSRNHLT